MYLPLWFPYIVIKDFIENTVYLLIFFSAKLIALGSDGASNMVGIRGGLAALLREDVNNEMINVHCFAHRLELSFRDVLKQFKQYDKSMTLLIGLYYFYTKQHKNKKGLLNTMEAFEDKGLLPTKVTGTRWIGQLAKGLNVLIKTYKIFTAHLSTISHQNAKAEGIVKIMMSKDLVCFMLFLNVSQKHLIHYTKIASIIFRQPYYEYIVLKVNLKSKHLIVLHIA